MFTNNFYIEITFDPTPYVTMFGGYLAMIITGVIMYYVVKNIIIDY